MPAVTRNRRNPQKAITKPYSRTRSRQTAFFLFRVHLSHTSEVNGSGRTTSTHPSYTI